MSTDPSSKVSAITPFIFGGISGCVAATIVLPIDTWKVRI